MTKRTRFMDKIFAIWRILITRLYYDVDLFPFYFLCECDDRGCHMVDYFSKEKARNGGCGGAHRGIWGPHERALKGITVTEESLRWVGFLIMLLQLRWPLWSKLHCRILGLWGRNGPRSGFKPLFVVSWVNRRPTPRRRVLRLRETRMRRERGCASCHVGWVHPRPCRRVWFGTMKGNALS